MVPDFRNKICQKATGVLGGLERAPGAGQVEVGDLTGGSALSKDESHGQTAALAQLGAKERNPGFERRRSHSVPVPCRTERSRDLVECWPRQRRRSQHQIMPLRHRREATLLLWSYLAAAGTPAARPGSGSLRGSLMRNHATQRAGRKSKVSKVATMRPPMIA